MKWISCRRQNFLETEEPRNCKQTNYGINETNGGRRAQKNDYMLAEKEFKDDLEITRAPKEEEEEDPSRGISVITVPTDGSETERNCC